MSKPGGGAAVLRTVIDPKLRAAGSADDGLDVFFAVPCLALDLGDRGDVIFGPVIDIGMSHALFCHADHLGASISQ